MLVCACVCVCVIHSRPAVKLKCFAFTSLRRPYDDARDECHYDSVALYVSTVAGQKPPFATIERRPSAFSRFPAPLFYAFFPTAAVPPTDLGPSCLPALKLRGTKITYAVERQSSNSVCTLGPYASGCKKTGH